MGISSTIIIIYSGSLYQTLLFVNTLQSLQRVFDSRSIATPNGMQCQAGVYIYTHTAWYIMGISLIIMYMDIQLCSQQKKTTTQDNIVLLLAWESPFHKVFVNIGFRTLNTVNVASDLVFNAHIRCFY